MQIAQEKQFLCATRKSYPHSRDLTQFWIISQHSEIGYCSDVSPIQTRFEKELVENKECQKIFQCIERSVLEPYIFTLHLKYFDNLWLKYMNIKSHIKTYELLQVIPLNPASVKELEQIQTICFAHCPTRHL